MSKRACLLTRQDVPKYIQNIVSRLQPVLVDFKDEDGDWWGYTFKLNAKWKCGYESQFLDDCTKLIRWCEGWYAHAKLIEYKLWYDEFGYMRAGIQRALKSGWRNHAYIVISDPVANRFEKDGFYRAQS